MTPFRLLSCGWLAVVVTPAGVPAAGRVEFNRDIRPILKDVLA